MNLVKNTENRNRFTISEEEFNSFAPQKENDYIVKYRNLYGKNSILFSSVGVERLITFRKENSLILEPKDPYVLKSFKIVGFNSYELLSDGTSFLSPTQYLKIYLESKQNGEILDLKTTTYLSQKDEYGFMIIALTSKCGKLCFSSDFRNIEKLFLAGEYGYRPIPNSGVRF